MVVLWPEKLEAHRGQVAVVVVAAVVVVVVVVVVAALALVVVLVLVLVLVLVRVLVRSSSGSIRSTSSTSNALQRRTMTTSARGHHFSRFFVLAVLAVQHSIQNLCFISLNIEVSACNWAGSLAQLGIQNVSACLLANPKALHLRAYESSGASYEID